MRNHTGSFFMPKERLNCWNCSDNFFKQFERGFQGFLVFYGGNVWVKVGNGFKGYSGNPERVLWGLDGNGILGLWVEMSWENDRK